MSFFQVDDKLPPNHKVRRLVDMTVIGERDGCGALGLWTMAGSYAQGAGTDGEITLLDALRLIPDRSLVTAYAETLVLVGLWHADGHQCRKCPPVARGGWRFHDWYQFGYDTAEGKRLADAKAKELQSPKLRAEVWARDSDDDGRFQRGPCRYCGKQLARKNMKGPTEDRPTMDHVDPQGAFGARNVVLACGACNKAKARRTPDQAEMPLRPAPRSSSSPDPLDVAPAPAAAASSRSVADEPDASQPERAYLADRAVPVDHGSDHADDPSDPGTRRGVLVGARGVGSGLGVGPVGSGEGSGVVGSAAPPARRKRRRRGGRGRGSPQYPDPQPAPAGSSPAAAPPDPPPQPHLRWDAGEPPVLLEPGRFGSPWHHHSGPPITDRENYCPDHDVPLPCRRCNQEP